ncbi:FeoA family protein [Qipengyuania oceanensis]|uniref:Ferrous iron transport protein A n=1 Tax=Qipengyuania oceanensis TaxID=1463597 RepID=A0A844YI52_9SPHN|nr:FeoA family protein [Qipengyuania oceanensis]MXO63811.1 ferrous iron transport protein A [Qipengyuania oceanensis]
MTLDSLKPGQTARIVAVAWDTLASAEGKRLRALGFDAGAEVGVAYRGVFAGSDPLAVTMGRMTVALRRVHARAMEVEPL